MKNKKALLRECQRYLFMVIGCVGYALGTRAFLIPCNIVGGGVSGAASLIHILTGLPAGIFIIALNIPILILGFRLMGWKFILRCLVTTVALGLFTDLFACVPAITDNPILAAMYGGILQGIGIGCFIKYEVSSGGTELLGRVTYHWIPKLSIAFHAAIFDSIVVITAAIVMKNPENVLYALIVIFVCAKISDLIVLGFNQAKLCYVITEKSEIISETLLAHSPRGITLLNGTGMYSKLPKDVLLTCVKNNQITQLKQTVKDLDPDAFVIVCAANEVYGKGFRNI